MKALVQPVLIPLLNVVNLLFVILYSNLCVDSNDNTSDNALIKALLASSVVYSSRIHSHWRRLLYVGTRRIVVTDLSVIVLL